MKEYSNVLSPDDRTSIPVRKTLKEVLDAERPKGLHGHQWYEMLLRAGFKAISEAKEPIAS